MIPPKYRGINSAESPRQAHALKDMHKDAESCSCSHCVIFLGL